MNKSTATKPKNIHANHRKRFKNKFLNNGLLGFDDHEVLELMLYYSIPQKDTNPIAHRLLERFSNFSNVFDASIAELCEVDGIKEHSAILIKLIPEIMKRYNQNKCREITEIHDQRMVKEYLTRKYDCSELEQFFIICLRSDNTIIESTALSTGTCSKVEIQIRELTNYVLKNNCTKIIISHNHPNCSPEPSDDDLVMTHKLVSSCILNDIEITDHVIISKDDVFSFKKSGHLKAIAEDVVQLLSIPINTAKYHKLMEPEGVYRPI